MAREWHQLGAKAAPREKRLKAF